jgi:hypothetical protein
LFILRERLEIKTGGANSAVCRTLFLFKIDSEKCGLKLAEHGGKNGKKRAMVGRRESWRSFHGTFTAL